MVKIKCPFCGEIVNTNLKSCPYCGKEFDDIKAEEPNNFNSVSPKDPSWVKKWNDKARTSKIVYLAIFLPLMLLIAFIIEILVIDLVGYSNLLLPTILIFSLYIPLIILIMISIIKRKNIIKVIDGYSVLILITNFHHSLVVEDEMQDSQFIYRFRYGRTYYRNLYGHLPNGVKIFADFKNRANGIEIKLEA